MPDWKDSKQSQTRRAFGREVFTNNNEFFLNSLQYKPATACCAFNCWKGWRQRCRVEAVGCVNDLDGGGEVRCHTPHAVAGRHRYYAWRWRRRRNVPLWIYKIHTSRT